MNHILNFNEKMNENQQNKKAYLIKLTDVKSDVLPLSNVSN